MKSASTCRSDWRAAHTIATCLSLIALPPVLTGCSSPTPLPSGQHLQAPVSRTGSPPEFITSPPLPAPPKPKAKPELYSVVVHNVEVQQLLFALARDAKINVDIHPGISGTVSMNVLDQTLVEILDRIARHIDMRYEMNGKSLSIMPDRPTYGPIASITPTSSATRKAASAPRPTSPARARHRRLEAAARAAILRRPTSATSATTVSGNPWSPICVTCCAKPTRSCRRVRAKP